MDSKKKGDTFSGGGLGFLSKLLSPSKAKAQKDIKMCILGLDNAGKTTILKAVKFTSKRLIVISRRNSARNAHPRLQYKEPL